MRRPTTAFARTPRPERTAVRAKHSIVDRRNVGEMRAVRPIVWPAYAVAAIFVVVALFSGIVNMSLSSQLRSNQAMLAQMNEHNANMARELAYQRSALEAMVSPDSQRYAFNGGEVVRKANRLYIAMDTMQRPPKGKVYEAWTRRAGAIRYAPSVTFVPDADGVAVVLIPASAASIVSLEVSVEPESGSKQPSSAPLFVVHLG
jgi:hypothetical protein